MEIRVSEGQQYYYTKIFIHEWEYNAHTHGCGNRINSREIQATFLKMLQCVCALYEGNI